MDTGNAQNPEDDQLFPDDEPPIIIEPLKVKRPSRTVQEIEALVVGLQVALATELNATKEEILQQIRDGQTAVETIARQMVRRIGTDGGNGRDRAAPPPEGDAGAA